MKKILPYAFFICLIGCNKLEPLLNIYKSNVKYHDLREQVITFADGSTNPEVAFPYFKKTYYLNGSVKTLYAVLQGNFGQIDTLEYLFVHHRYKTEIRLYAKGQTNFDNPYPPDTLNFTAYFDANSGNVISIGADAFNYSNGQLIEACGHRLEYDSLGNLIFLKQSGGSIPATRTGLQYEYDYSQKAGNADLYNVTSLWFGRSYCLAEVMGWIPPMTKNRRVKEIVNFGTVEGTDTDYIVDVRNYSNHTFSPENLLISVKYNSHISVNNSWRSVISD